MCIRDRDPKASADVYMFANDQLEPLIKANAIAKLGGDTAEYVKSSNSEAMAATVTYDGDIYACLLYTSVNINSSSNGRI